MFTLLCETFWGTTKKYENKNLTYFFLFVRDWDGNGYKFRKINRKTPVSEPLF